MKQILPLALATVLAACAGEVPSRVPVTLEAAPNSVRIAWASVELREVTLPSYAAEEDIFATQADGTLQSLPSVVWADDPERAVTLQLARAMATMTGARVASSPWPLSDFPQVTVEVRIEEFVADAAGNFIVAGQYFVAPDAGRDRAGLFRLSAPIAQTGTATDLAAARGAVIAELADLIAREGLR